MSAKSCAEGAPNYTGWPEARNLVNFTLVQMTVWAMSGYINSLLFGLRGEMRIWSIGSS